MRTVQGSDTTHQYTIGAAMDHPPYRDVTVGDLLTRLAGALPTREALVYAQGPRYTFEALDREACTIAKGLMALGVERGERVVALEADVARKVVPRPVGHDDERQVALDCHRRDGRHRAVAACGRQHLGARRACQLRRILAVAQHVRLDSALPRGRGELVGGGALGPGARVDQEETAHRPQPTGVRT